MRRLFKVFAASVLGIGLLVGCSNGQGDAEGDIQSVGLVAENAEGQRQDGERITLTLGTVGRGSDGMLKTAVEAYNAQGGKYNVEIVDYLPENYDNAVWEASEDRFKMDLATGKGTDIVDLYSMEASELGYRGILADLNGFMTPQERQERYVANILDAVQTGDALYEMGPSFSLWTIVGDSSRVGSGNGWTLEEMLKCFEKNGKDAEALTGLWLGQSIATLLTQFSLEEFVDWETGKADFCNKKFYEILEFGAQLVGEPTARVRPTRESIASGTHLAYMDIFLNVYNVQYMDWLFGRNMAFKGFPCSSGTGVAVSLYYGIGINENSQCKEGAWDFLKFYVAGSWAAENSWMITGFPLDRQAFEEELGWAMVQEYRDGEPIPKNINSDAEGPAIYAATEEEIEQVRELIGLADRRMESNAVISRIIDEEVNGYNSGSLTAEQTAQKIQNRVQLYLDEQGQ